MKTAMTMVMVALLATAGAATAGEPMVLTDAQLDKVTAAGPVQWFGNDKGFGFIQQDGGSERPAEGMSIIFVDGSVRISWDSVEVVEISPPVNGDR
jgi:hypothetical protein